MAIRESMGTVATKVKKDGKLALEENNHLTSCFRLQLAARTHEPQHSWSSGVTVHTAVINP